ncbi:MAG: ATP-binding cassette domain-containing protein [Desulfosalsimonas sp.]
MYVRNANIESRGRVIFSDLNLELYENQHLAVAGEAGSGKSILLRNMAGNSRLAQGKTGQCRSGPAVYVDIRHDFKPSCGAGDFFYQQRFNAGYADESQTVEEYLAAGAKDSQSRCRWRLDDLYETFSLESVRHRHLIKLSSGEIKRLRLAAAVLRNPGILFIDSPLAGLDAKNRKIFEDVFLRIADSGTRLVMAADPWHIPRVVTHVAVPDEAGGIRVYARNEYSPPAENSMPKVNVDIKRLGRLLNSGQRERFDVLVSMHNAKVAYGETVIFRGVCWQIRQGERWALSGPNGSGKSTLLSLINGDHPQAYANDIILFDRRRGSGESIWEIKKKIGFMSPELFQYFPMQYTCLQVVESGFYNTMGIVMKSRGDNQDKACKWMEIMGIAELRDRYFFEVSADLQRMCLLARALVKNPYLLILDEPCQGLDLRQQNVLRQLIDIMAEISDFGLVYVTHQAEELPSCIDQTLELG